MVDAGGVELHAELAVLVHAPGEDARADLCPLRVEGFLFFLFLSEYECQIRSNLVFGIV